MFYQNNHDAVFYTGILDDFKNENSDSKNKNNSDNIIINNNKIDNDDDDDNKNFLKIDDEKIKTETIDIKPSIDSKDFKLKVIEFRSDIEYKKKFKKITLLPIKCTSFKDMPWSSDPRKIRQCMRECLELLLKIVPKYDDTVNYDNYYSFLKSRTQIKITLFETSAKEKIVVSEKRTKIIEINIAAKEKILADNFKNFNDKSILNLERSKR